MNKLLIFLSGTIVGTLIFASVEVIEEHKKKEQEKRKVIDSVCFSQFKPNPIELNKFEPKPLDITNKTIYERYKSMSKEEIEKINKEWNELYEELNNKEN